MRFFLLAFTPLLAAQTVWFEPNQGQVVGQTEWVGRTKGAYLYITGNEVLYANGQKNVQLRVIGARKHPRAEGLDRTGGYSSYFMGRGEKTWVTGVTHYSRLKYADIYPGIDMVYYATGRNIEYDFVVKSEGNTKQIELAFSEPVTLDHGDLIVAGLRQHKPRVLQNGHQIAANYRISGSNRVQVALAKYDHTRDLVIDPVLEFSTFIGGPGADEGIQTVLDSSGSIYLTGFTQSPASPSLNPFQQTNIVNEAPFVMKMTPQADHVVYFAVLGSNGWDSATGMAIDPSGSIVVVGVTSSPTFPLKNAFQSNFISSFWTGFVTKLSPDARSLVYSTYYGGSYEDNPIGVLLDLQGNAYVSGGTASTDIPVLHALQPDHGSGFNFDCYVGKISTSGALIFSTYLGGSGVDYCYGQALASDGSLFVVGASSSSDFPLENPIQTEAGPLAAIGRPTPVLVKMSGDGQTLLYSTFLGGPIAGVTKAIAFDLVGNIYLAGQISGTGLITKNAFQSTPAGPQSVFFMKLDPSGQNLIYSSYLGGNSAIPAGVAVDAQGSIYVAGLAESADFPTKNSLQEYKGGGVLQGDFFIAKFAPSGNQLIYSTLLGGSNNELGPLIFVDSAGNVFGTGETASEDFPTKNAYQPTYGGGGDAVLFKISDATVLPPSPLTPSPGHLAFSYIQGGSAPATQTVSVTGGQFTAASNASWLSLTPNGSGISVSVNPASLSPGTYQGSISLAPPNGSPASVDVSLNVLAAAPVLSSVNPSFVAVGSNDTTITIHGSGFTTNSSLQVEGIPWLDSPVVFVDSSTLQFTLKASYFTMPYNIPVAVQNPQAALSNLLSVAVGQPAPQFTAASIVNAASYLGGGVAPGEIVTVYGSNFGDQSNTQVTFDYVPATILYVTSTQLAVTVPYFVSGTTSMIVTSNGVASVPVTLNVVPSVPAIFSSDASGKGQAAALNQDYSVNSGSHPASVGSVVMLYGTGGGTLNTDSLPQFVLQASAMVGGVPAQVLYAGIAPGLVQGAMQINVQIPNTVTSGPAVPVTATIGNSTSNTVTIAIQ